MIKSNIDLTSNEMFSKPIRNFSLHKMLRSFPWNLRFTKIFYDSDLNSRRNEVVLTGNKKEREEKELCRQGDSGDYCDYCGASLIEIPWDRTYGLCKRCYADMESLYENKTEYPWGKASEMKGQRGKNPLFW